MTTAEPTITPDLTADTAKPLVSRRAFLKAEKQRVEKELASIEAQIVQLGPGEYLGENGERALVISPAPTVQMPKYPASKEVTAQIKEIIGDDTLFKKLFWFVGGYVLCKNFRTAAGVALTPARLQKVLALLETPSASYVK